MAIDPPNPERIHSARLSAGLTQSELARRIGASSNGVISKWETSTTKPSGLFLKRLFRALPGAFDIQELPKTRRPRPLFRKRRRKQAPSPSETSNLANDSQPASAGDAT